ITSNSALTNPTTTSTAKLLTLTSTVPVAPATFTMTNDLVSTTTAVTIISKFIGTATEFTLRAAASALANTYSWEIPDGVNVVAGSDLTSNSIKVNFAGVTAGTTVTRIGVKAVNGVGSSITSNSALTNPTTTSTAKLLTLTSTVPAAPATLTLTDGATATAITVVSKFIGTNTTFKLTAAASALANTYSWELPIGANRTDASGNAVDGLTSNDPFIFVNFANVPHESTTISLVFGVKAVNGVGSSSTKPLTVTAGLPSAVTAVTGLVSVCSRSQGYEYTITAPAGATSYTITAPVGSTVSSLNGVQGVSNNILTTTDLTFKVVYSGTAAFPTTDKTLSILSRNVFGPATAAKAIPLTKVATCPLAKAEMASDDFKVVAYPNPYSSAFQLDFTTSSESQVEIRVYDMIGKLIETRQFSTAEMNNQEVGNSYPSGIYNVIVTQGENMKTLRVIKR
ncbi:T9SS type A sorting domain-containing protein, partial [Flavobacterium sp.]|uniref:T9SS type A sorting domain-containing protein n=1 Tax=Flavobacterium sp. TaxID=239 RepID=UPI003BCC6FC8